VLGDEVLRQVSSLFHQQLRKVDVGVPYGGEEFGILLTRSSHKRPCGGGKTPQDGGGLAVSGRAPDRDLSAGPQLFQHGHPRRARKGRDSALYAAKQAGPIKSSCLTVPKRQAPRARRRALAARIGQKHCPSGKRGSWGLLAVTVSAGNEPGLLRSGRQFYARRPVFLV